MSTELTYLIFPKSSTGGGWGHLFDRLNATGEEAPEETDEVFRPQVLQTISPLGLDAHFVYLFDVTPEGNNYVTSIAAIVYLQDGEKTHIPQLETQFSVRPFKALEDFLGVEKAQRYLDLQP